MLVGFGSVPFLVWKYEAQGIWPVLSLGLYVTTAILLLWIRIGYPGSGNPWYWKSVVPIIALHALTALMLTAAALAIDITGVKPPTRMFFGFVTGVLPFELYVHQRLVSRFDPNERK